jgi:glucose-6-phosphate 1-dehydrogenase
MTDEILTNPLRIGLRMHRTPEPCTVVIFGATGDLTHRKLVPALYNLQRERLLPPGFSVIGAARREWSDDYFRQGLRDDTKTFSRSGLQEDLWQTFAEGISYVRVAFDDPAGYQALATRLAEIDAQRGTAGNRLFYLATPPESYATIIQHSVPLASLAHSPILPVLVRLIPNFIRSFKNHKSIGLITIWEKKRFRIFWYFGLPMVFSNHSGTIAILIMYRLLWLKA